MNNINFFQRLLFCVGCVFLVSVMAPGCDERSTVPLGYGGVYGETPGENACAPSCAFKGCGDDGCGGSCGTCDEGLACQGYACVDADCAAQCDNVVCGADGCGGVCGLCGVNELCEEGLCVLDPNAVIGEPSEEDLDGDGIINGSDNCPEVANLDQADQDADWQGDVCDTDRDGDGFLNELDCEPEDPSIYPGAPELCHNGVDENCNDLVDEEGAYDCIDHFIDADGDGAGATDTLRCLCEPEGEHQVIIAGDCDDLVAAISPLAPEACDGADNNCNLLVDEGCDDDGDGYCDWNLEYVNGADVCPQGPGDCHDYWDLVHPGAIEIADDGVDNDCDGTKYEPSSSGTIPPECPPGCGVGHTKSDFLCAMEICFPDNLLQSSFESPTNDVIDSAWDAMERYGSPANDLAPFAGGSYAVMGSGAPYDFEGGGGIPCFSDLDCGLLELCEFGQCVGAFGGSSPHQHQLPGSGSASDPFDSLYSDMWDAVEFKVRLKAPEGVTGFSIDYIYMSAEYHEYVGTQWNDKFYIKLRGPETTGNQWEVINFAQCLNPGSYFDKMVDGQPVCYIAINAAFAEPCNAGGGTPPGNTRLDGTGHTCEDGGSSTGWLTTSWTIKEGEVFDLVFHIHDTGDEIYDSTVVLDNFRWEGGTVIKGTDSHN